MTTPRNSAQAELWPALPYEDWKDTCTTLHLWTQIVGKVRLAQTPWANHSWHVTLYVTPRGLTTSPIPYDGRALSGRPHWAKTGVAVARTRAPRNGAKKTRFMVTLRAAQQGQKTRRA